jgi:hypothetical protein
MDGKNENSLNCHQRFPATSNSSFNHFPAFPDEQIIRRRLQIDGEGVGDDRKINLLLKTFCRWTNSTEDESQDRIITQ